MFINCRVVDKSSKIIELLEAPGVGNAFVTVDDIPAGLDDDSYFTVSYPDMTVVEKVVVPIADGDITLAQITKLTTIDGKITKKT